MQTSYAAKLEFIDLLEITMKIIATLSIHYMNRPQLDLRYFERTWLPF